MNTQFRKLARSAADMSGSPWAFLAALLATLAWLATGPYFGWSDAWNFLANTTTTVTTFLMIFLLQSSQNSDSASLHAKLDELLRAVPDADDAAGKDQG